MSDTTLRDKLFNQLQGFDLNANRLVPLSLDNAKVGVLYSAQFNTLGSVGLVVYSILAGALPPGVTFSSSGLLSGTPTAMGTYSFVIQSVDSDSIPEIVAGPYTLSIAQATLVLYPLTLPAAAVGIPYNEVLSTSGGTAPYTYSLAP